MTITKLPATKPNGPDEVHERILSPMLSEHSLAKSHSAPPPKSGFAGKLLAWAIVLSAAGAGWHYRETLLPLIGLEQKVATTPPARIVPVVTSPVLKKDMEVFINGLGTVTAFKTVTIRSRVEGELVKVHFTEGQIVKEGDPLAEIDKRTFEVQKQQAEGQLARDEATLETANLTMKRYQDLLASKNLAAQAVDEQRALVQQTIGAIQSDHAMIESAKLQLVYCNIIAPITGRIGLRLVDQGNIVRANDPTGLAVITQLQPISLLFTIPQDDISRVQKASLDGKELVVTAWDRGFQTKLATGKLLAIDNQVDSTTGTVRLKAIFENEDGLLFPNQFVNVRLLVDTKKDAVVVPSAAVQRGPTSTFVYVINSEKDPETGDTIEKAELRNISAGLVEGAETAITSGLEPGEVVVTEGLDKLTKDAKVTTPATAAERAAKEAKAKDKGDSKEKGGKKADSSSKEPASHASPKHPSDAKGKSEAKNPEGKKAAS